MKRNRGLYSLAGLLCLSVVLVYLPALRNGFVEWDDNQYVFENPHIRSIGRAFFEWAFSTFYAGNWHPLTWISHALDYAVWGLNPMGHHLTNILLHGLNTFLVVVLVARLVETACARQCAGGDSQQAIKTRENKLRNAPSGAYPATSAAYSRFALVAAGVTGLLFGIHPIHVESVAWVAERKDLLCAFFYLLSILMYARYVAAVSMQGARDTIQKSAHKGEGTVYSMRHALGPMLSALSFFVLALLSKPMAVSLPFVLLILDWYPFERLLSVRSFLSACIEKIPFFLLSIASSVLTVLAQKSGGAMGLMESVSLPTRLLVAGNSLITYLLHIVLPVNLIFFYPYPKGVSLFSAAYLVPLLLIAAITAASLIAARKNRVWVSAWAYFIVTLMPVIGIVQVGMQARADRYTYLPGLGPSILLGLAAAWGVARLARLGRKGVLLTRISSALAVACLVSLASLTVAQVSVWSDSITLWSSIIAKEPEGAFFAFHNRGIAFSRRGQYDRAIEDYRKAIALRPRFADTYSNLGIALMKKGLPDQAIENYRIAISLNPRLVGAHKNLASALYLRGSIPEALEQYRIVTELSPDDAGAEADLGATYGAIGEYQKAIDHLERALRLNPALADAHYNLATAYSMTGRQSEAREHFEEALRLAPRNTGGSGTP